MAFLLPAIFEGGAALLGAEGIGAGIGAAVGEAATASLLPVITDAAATLLTEEAAATVGAAITEAAVGSLTGAAGLETAGTLAAGGAAIGLNEALGVAAGDIGGQIATGAVTGISEAIGGGVAETGLVESILTGTATGTTAEIEGAGTTSAVIDTLATTTSGIDDLALTSELAGVGEAAGENLILEGLGEEAGAITTIEGETVAAAATEATITDQLLGALGISKETVGEHTYTLLAGAITGGVISEQDIQNALTENATHLFNKIIDTIAGDSDVFSDYSKFIIVGPNGQIIDAEDVYKAKEIKYIDCFELGYSTGIMLTEEAFNLFQFDQRGIPRDKSYLLAVIKTSTENKEHAYIARQFSNYLKSSEYINDPHKSAGIVNQLKATYNGNYQSKAWIDADFNTHIIDETGAERTFQYSEDAYLNLFGHKFSVPQLHGNYVGPGSIGGELPIDEFDQIAMLHDIAYDDHGYFSHYADLQLIARLESWLEKHPIPDETNDSFYDKVLFTKFYFTYVAPLASEMAGNMNSPEIEEYLAAKSYDFFEYVMFQTIGDVSLDYSKFGYKNPLRKYQVLLKDEQRNHFYAGMKMGIDQNTQLIYQKMVVSENLAKIEDLEILNA